MKKLVDKRGLTLTEMLACVITLLLIGGVCTAGMNLAIHSYQESIFESESQMLESTLELYLCDILRYSTDILPEGNGNDEEIVVSSFTNVAYRIYDGNILLSNELQDVTTGVLMYQSRNGYVNMLVGEKVYTENLYISDFELKYNHEKKYFTGSYVIKSKILEHATRECEFTCRTIANY